MSSTTDNLIAFKILYMLVTPFEKTDAYKFGIIDKDGNALKKVKDLDDSEERDSYTALHRLIFNLKKLLAKVPGGKSRFASVMAAYWLVKENVNLRTSIKETELMETIEIIEFKKLSLIEEEIDFKLFLESLDEEGAAAIANTVGDGTATSVDQPTIKPKKKKTLKLFRRQKDGEYVKV